MKYTQTVAWILAGIFLVTLMFCDYRNPSTIDQNSNANYIMETTVDQPVIFADNGKTVAKITVSLRNDQDEPLAGRTINFAATSGAITSSVQTSSSGLAVGTFDDKGRAVDSVRIVTRYTDDKQVTVRDTIWVDVLPLEEQVGNLRIFDVDDRMVGSLEQTFNINIRTQVMDDGNSPIPNVPVRFKLTGDDPIGYFDSSVDSSDNSGFSNVIFHSYPGAIGAVNVLAYVSQKDAEMAVRNSGAVLHLEGLAKEAETVLFSDSLTFNLVSPSPYRLTLGTTRDSIFVDDGITVASINAVLKNTDELPVKNARITFSATGNVGVINSPVRTDSSGMATATFKDLGDRNHTGTAKIVASYNHPFAGIIKDSVNVKVVLQSSGTYLMEATVDKPVIFADNGKTVSKVTVSLHNDQDEPLAGRTINFATTSGAITSTVQTSSSGLAVATFDDKGRAVDEVRIVARYTDEQEYTVRDTVWVSVLPLEEQVGNLHLLGVGDLQVQSPSQSVGVQLRSQVIDDANSPIPNIPVHFKITGDTPIGYLQNAVDSSDVSGFSTVMFNSYPGELGTVRAMAYVSRDDAVQALQNSGATINLGDAAESTETILFSDTVSFNLLAPSPYELTVVTTRDTIFTDNGATVANIQAILRDTNQQPVENASIAFSASGNVGVINSPVQTNSSGLATATFRDLGDQDRIGTATIIASFYHPFFGIIKDSLNVEVIPRSIYVNRDPATITLRSQYYSLPTGENNEITKTKIYATIQDTTGEFIDSNYPVYFSLDPPNRGVITAVAVTEDSGTAKATFNMGTSAGVVNIIATVPTNGGNEITKQISLQIRPDVPKYILIPPARPDKIQVQGGGGQESTTLLAEIYDANGQLISEEYDVEFQLGPNVPAGANINNHGLHDVATSNAGIATVTLNSGSGAGPVRVSAAIQTEDTTIQAIKTPVTIEAGAPAYISANLDPLSSTQVGGGIYQMEAGAIVRDRYSNMVADSTHVYWWIEPDTIADVLGTSFTGNDNQDGDHFPGNAYTTLYYPSSVTFDTFNLHAVSWGANGDSVESVVKVNGDTPRYPFNPGQLLLSGIPLFWDFTLQGNPAQIAFTATLIDKYGTAIDNGPIMFNATGVSQWLDANGNPVQQPIAITNSQGQATLIGVFNQGLCTPIPGTDPQQYNTFEAVASATLLLPQQTNSDEVTISFIRSVPE